MTLNVESMDTDMKTGHTDNTKDRAFRVKANTPRQHEI